MNQVNFVDQSLRDGAQSFWACRLGTPATLPIAPIVDEVGYQYVDFMPPVIADGQVRFLHENPFEKIRLFVKAMPKTPLGASVRVRCLHGFDTVPDSVFALWIRLLAENGIKRIFVTEALLDWNGALETYRMCKAVGLEVTTPLVFSLNPVYTDEFYAQKTAEAVKLFKPNYFWIKDSIGLLTPDRVKTLIPVIQRNSGGIPIEIHSHCSTGLAPLCCLEAIKLGIKTVHTCVSPLANGPSLPSAENMISNLSRLGYTTNINEKAVEVEAAYLAYLARKEGRPMGAPVEYNVFQYMHQIPGGMVGTLKSMLQEQGMEHQLQAVLEEVTRIVKEWGYPTMITPYSQIVTAQATFNLSSGERYKVVPKETIKYLLGYYGTPPAPIDQNIKDKVAGLPQAKPFLNWKQPQPSIEDLRKQIGMPGISDEELALRILWPKTCVDAIRPIEIDSRSMSFLSLKSLSQ